MKIRAFALLTLLFCALPLFASDYTDVIVMKNGDRLTCEIMSLQTGVLSVKLPYVDGAIGVDWSAVAHLESSRLFVITTESGAVYTGTLTTFETAADRPVGIQIAVAGKEAVAVTTKEVVRVDRTSQKFWQRFSGAVDTGILYSKGNDSTQYNLSSDVEYQRDRWSAQAAYNSSLASSNATNATTRNQGDISSLRLLRWNNWFYTGRASFLQSSVQNINLQTTLGGGIGRYLLNSNKTKFYLAGGLAWQNTVYSSAISLPGSQNALAAYASSNLEMFKFKKTDLELFAIILPDISSPGRVHANATAAYYIKLFSNLSWNFSFYGDWDNQPPPTLSGSDYGTSSGLSWKFGNR
jgi:Protein of unknown function, DUF481